MVMDIPVDISELERGLAQDYDGTCKPLNLRFGEVECSNGFQKGSGQWSPIWFEKFYWKAFYRVSLWSMNKSVSINVLPGTNFIECLPPLEFVCVPSGVVSGCEKPKRDVRKWPKEVEKRKKWTGPFASTLLVVKKFWSWTDNACAQVGGEIETSA